MCPVGKINLNTVEGEIDSLIQNVSRTDPGGFFPGPTKERDVFINELQKYAIDDLTDEGFSIAAFNHAADHLIRVNKSHSDNAYNYKMLLGQCLGTCLYRSNG